MNLSEAKVLITGGSSGIGLETARHLIAQGAKVAICGRNASKLVQVAEAIGAIALPADVSKENDVQSMVTSAIEKLGGLNVLVNNAAYGQFGMLTDLETHTFQDLIATNVVGAMMVGRECAKYFVAQQYGNIINISSTAGRAGFAGGTAYVASKFALAGMTECWRAELRKFNVRVMLLNPSEVQTDFVVNSGREARPFNTTKLQSKEIAHTIAMMLSMDNVGFITEATVWATNPQN
jgi:3-oxoacyl-[acyl-carrier protein] reductase